MLKIMHTEKRLSKCSVNGTSYGPLTVVLYTFGLLMSYASALVNSIRKTTADKQIWFFFNEQSQSRIQLERGV